MPSAHRTLASSAGLGATFAPRQFYSQSRESPGQHGADSGRVGGAWSHWRSRVSLLGACNHQLRSGHPTLVRRLAARSAARFCRAAARWAAVRHMVELDLQGHSLGALVEGWLSDPCVPTRTTLTATPPHTITPVLELPSSPQQRIGKIRLQHDFVPRVDIHRK